MGIFGSNLYKPNKTKYVASYQLGESFYQKLNTKIGYYEPQSVLFEMWQTGNRWKYRFTVNDPLNKFTVSDIYIAQKRVVNTSISMKEYLQQDGSSNIDIWGLTVDSLQFGFTYNEDVIELDVIAQRYFDPFM